MNDVNERLKKNICQVLERSLDDIDDQTAIEISRLKYNALEASRNRKPLIPFYRGVVATTFLVVVSVFLFSVFDQSSQPLFSPDTIDLQVLLTDDTFDFYTDEIEFYEWLSEMLENDPDLFDRRSDLSINAIPWFASGTGRSRHGAAEFRTDRVSGGI